MSTFQPAAVKWSAEALRGKKLLDRRATKVTDVAAPPAVQLDINRGFEAVVEIIDLDGTEHQEFIEIDPQWGEVSAGFSVPVFEKAEALFPSLWKKMHLLNVMQKNADGDYDTDHQWEPPSCPTKYRDNPDHWIKKDEERKKFWSDSNALAKSLGIKAGKPQRDWVHEALNSERMEDFGGSRDQAMKILTAAVQAAKGKPAEPTNATISDADLKKLKEQIGAQYKWLAINAQPSELGAWFKEDSGGHKNVDEALKHMTGDALFEMIAKAVKARHDTANGNTAPAEPPPQEDAPADEEPVTPPAAETVATMPSFTVEIKMPAVATLTTLTGIPLADVEQRLDDRYPREAYGVIELLGGKAGTDIGYDYARDRFVQVFGLQGVGWRFTVHSSGGVVCEKKTYTKIDRYTKQDKEVVEYHVSLIAHVFEYRIVKPDGSMEWVQLAPMSDAHASEDEGHAYRGAETSLLKHVLRSMGGFNHLYRYDKLKAWATKELAAIKAAKKAARNN